MDFLFEEILNIGALVFLMGLGVVAFVAIVFVYLAVLDAMENFYE